MSTATATQLSAYRVSYVDLPGDTDWWVFDCTAEDDDHAEEQCRNAYPQCDIINITRLGAVN
jgi:hypothetical protein